MPTQLRDVLESGSPVAIDEKGDLVSRDELARRYYATRVVLRNDSDVPFEGHAATVDGIETPIPPHEEEVVNLGFVHEVLGNAWAWGDDRTAWRKEYNRLNHRFERRRVNIVIPQEQIDNQARLIQLGYMQPEDAAIADVEIPQLIVLDRESGMTLEPPRGWPLYNENPKPVVDMPEGTVPRSEFDALVAQMEQIASEVKRG